MAKDSFILYDVYGEQIKLLSNEDSGQVFKAIYAHRNGEKLPTMSSSASLVFALIRAQMTKDNEKYIDTCEKRATGGQFGKLGGRPNNNTRESWAAVSSTIERIKEINKTGKPQIPQQVQAEYDKLPESVKTYYVDKSNFLDLLDKDLTIERSIFLRDYPKTIESA